MIAAAPATMRIGLAGSLAARRTASTGGSGTTGRLTLASPFSIAFTRRVGSDRRHRGMRRRRSTPHQLYRTKRKAFTQTVFRLAFNSESMPIAIRLNAQTRSRLNQLRDTNLSPR